MIIQATPYGTKKEEPFAFTYSGDFTDSRVDGIGDVTLNTSGVFEVLSGKTTVSVYILGAGGGCGLGFGAKRGTGGSGGYQTVEVTLEPSTYDIVIGTGGTTQTSGVGNGGNGGDTAAFGQTSTGGQGGQGVLGGAGGNPNGNSGSSNNAGDASGGSPNGGSVVNGVAQPGGNGIVRITFS